MLNKTLIRVILLIFILLSAVSAHADEQVVFGPEMMKIKFWRTHLSFHSFESPQAETGKIFITKNNKWNRIKYGFVLINEQFISLRSFLKSRELTFEREVSLDSRNYMMVFLLGKRNASVSISVKATGLVPLRMSLSRQSQRKLSVDSPPRLPGPRQMPSPVASSRVSAMWQPAAH